MNSNGLSKLALEFDELIHGPFVQQIFVSSSFSKAESLLLEFISENDHQSLKRSSDLNDDQKDQKENDQSLQQQQKIHQLKTKLILSLQGPSCSSSSSSSSSSEDQKDENNPCRIESQGLIEKVFSFKQRLRDFSSDSVSSVPLPTGQNTTNIEENHQKSRGPFDKWSDSDCQLFLEEIGTPRTTIQSIQNRLQRDEKSFCQSLHSIHRSLENPSDLVSECRKEVPELSREQMSRLLIGLEMLSLGFGIVQIPQWWIDQQLMKPMDERNLMSINNGSEQVVQWMEKNLFPFIEQQLNEEEKEKIISSIKSNRSFSGCQSLYFLEEVLLSSLESRIEKQRSIKETVMNEKQRLFKDLEKQLVIIGNSDYDPEKEDQNIHFFDPVSRIQRKLSNQVGTWSSPPLSSFSSSFGIQTTSEPANESSSTSIATGLKIQSIMNEINEIKRQHECKQENDDEDESNQKRIQSNLPPRNECAWDILRSFLRKETFGIRQLRKENNERIPEEIKYLNQKDLEWIELDQFFKSIYEAKGKLRPKALQSLDGCTKIMRLNLKGFGIRSIPAEIGHLKNLQRLDLNDNQLTSIPAEIGQMKNLQRLDLYKNQLTSIPAEIGQMTNLQALYLGENQLTSIPAEISQMKNLQRLDLYKNQLTLIPAEIGQMMNLQTLNLYKNQLTSIPAEIGHLTNLQALYLKKNQLTSIPAEIGLMTNLQALFLQCNPNLPAEFRDRDHAVYANLKKLGDFRV